MRKIIYILIAVLLPISGLYGQKRTKKAKKSQQQEILEEEPTFSSKDYPYIERFHKAINEKILGNFDEAIALLEENLEERQDDDAVYFLLAEIAQEKKQRSEVLQYLEKAYEIDRDNITYLEELAFSSFSISNFEKAEKLFEELCLKEARNPDYRFAYIQTLLYNREYQKAVNQIDILQSQNGIIPEIMNMKLDLLNELGKQGEIERTLLQLREEYPDEMYLVKRLIEFYNESKQPEKTTAIIEEMVGKHPENDEFRLELAKDYLRNNKTSEFVREAVQLIADSELEIGDKMILFENIKKLKSPTDPELLKVVEELYSEKPDNVVVAQQYVAALVAQRRSKDALPVLRLITEANASNYEMWRQTLLFESDFKEYQSLYEDSQKALEYFPSLPILYLFASEGALYTGRWDEAKQFLDAGEIYLLDDSKGMQAEFLSMRAQIDFAQNDYKNGIVKFEKAISLYANDETIVSYALALAKANIAKGEPESLLNRIKEKDFSTRYYYAKALVEKNNKRIEEGIKILKEGIEKMFNNAELLDALGDFYFEKGELTEAKANWKNALENESRNTVLKKKIEEGKWYEAKYY